jgi:hypothetical protein
MLQRRAMPGQIASLLKSHERVPWLSDEGIHLLGLRATIYRFVAPLDSLTSMVTQFAVLGYYNLALVEEWIARVQKEASLLSVQQLISVVRCVKRLHRFTSGLSESQANQILSSLPIFPLLVEPHRSPVGEGETLTVRVSTTSASLLCQELVEMDTSFARVLASWIELSLQTSLQRHGFPNTRQAEICYVPFANSVVGSIQRAVPDVEILLQVAEMAERLPSSEECRSIARLIGVSMTMVVGRYFSALSDAQWDLLLRVNDALARPSLFSADLQKSRRLIVLGFCKFLSLGREPKEEQVAVES